MGANSAPQHHFPLPGALPVLLISLGETGSQSSFCYVVVLIIWIYVYTILNLDISSIAVWEMFTNLGFESGAKWLVCCKIIRLIHQIY